MAYMGKESEREGICVHVQPNHFVYSRNYDSTVNQLYLKKKKKGSRVATAVAQSPSLAQELPHAAGVAIKF